MERQAKQEIIRRFARQISAQPARDLILWSRHAVSELLNEGWRRSDVEVGLADCEIIEDYETLTRPLPDCLVIGVIGQTETFHAVVAVDELNERLLIVTVYQPAESEWNDDWRTRKR